MTFLDDVKSDFKALITDATGGFAESVVVYVNGTARTINAVPAPLRTDLQNEERSYQTARQLTLQVADHATDGITATELADHLDTIYLEGFHGTDWDAQEITEQDVTGAVILFERVNIIAHRRAARVNAGGGG